MGLVDGTNLGDIWVDLSKKARITVVTKLVEFPASDSLYYTKDLPAEYKKVDVPIAESEQDSRFCIGPDTRLSLWYGKRLDIQVDRGRCTYQLCICVQTIDQTWTQQQLQHLELKSRLHI